MTPGWRVSTTVLLTLFLVLTGCQAGENSLVNIPEEDPDATETINDVVAGDAGDTDLDGTLTVSDQVSDGTFVTIDGADIELSSGWVAVFLDRDGGPGELIGSARLGQGAAGSMEVELEQQLQGDTTLWAQLHRDTEPVGTFEWPGVDEPLTGAGGDVVKASFQVEIDPQA